MATLNTSLSDMPWLGQPADPTSLLRGVAAGSQIAANRRANASLAQQKMEFERTQALRESANEREAQLFPLAKTLQQQQVDMQAAKLTDFLKNRQYMVEDEKTMGTFMDWANKEMAKGTVQGVVEAHRVASQGTAQLSRLLDNPKWQMFLKDLDARGSFILNSKKAEADILQSTAAITHYANMGTSQALSPMGKMIAERNRAVQLGDNVAVSAYDAAIKKAATPTGMRVTTNPDGTMTLEQGTLGDITTATRTRLQQQEMSDSEATRTLSDAIAGIEANPTAIGVRGVVGSAVEKARGQLSPTESFATPITDTRQKASIAFSRVAPALRVDSGNMSKYELNKLEQAGDVLDPTEAPQTALNKLRNLQAVVTARQLRVLKAQGKPVDEATLRSIQGSEIAGLLQSGLLTTEDAMRLYQLHRNAK